MITLMEKTAAKLALIDDYAIQRTTKGIVTCLGGDPKQALILEMVADGLLCRPSYAVNYGVQYYELTEAGWKWEADKRALQ